ncbi:MAG TPA: hypothetical protein DCR44_08115 [Acholeplasmatales bacterium]|nr:MAG: hypothetical protein A2Y16_04015 [Tenericutes bacterium GWF2_57_13]HAQ57333.1 hypothetical protein [Acholeplasmatales bacterium]
MIYQPLIALALLLACIPTWILMFRKRTLVPAEVRIELPKSLFRFFVGMLGLVTAGSIVLIVFSLLGTISLDDFEPIAALIGMFLFMSVLMVLGTRIEDTALIDEMIVIRSAFRKEKRIPIERIQYIEANQQIVSFFDERRKMLFQAMAMTQRLPELIKAIAKRERFRSIDLTQIGGERLACPRKEEYEVLGSEPGENVLIRLGREYRSRIPKMKRDAKLAAWTMALIQVVAVTILILMTHILFYLIFLPMAAVGAGTTYEMMMKKTKVDELSDRDLGLLYGHLDPHVVGSYRARTKQGILMAWILGPMFLLMGILLAFVALPSSLPDLSALETVSGAYLCVTENGDGDVFVFLDGDDTVYRISDIYTDGLSDQIRASADLGDTVTLGFETRFEGTYDGEDATIANVYLVSVEGVDLLDADDVLRADAANQRLGVIMAVAMNAVGAVTTILGVWLVIHRKRAEERETIRL